MDAIGNEAMLDLVEKRLCMTMVHIPAWKNGILAQLKR
jgi:hypothetical protein